MNGLMKNIYIILISAITIIFLMFPNLVILINNKKLTILYLFIFGLLIALSKYKKKSKKNKLIKISNFKVCFILYIISLIIYLTVVIIIYPNFEQISDFKNAFLHSINPVFDSDYYLMFTHWIYYPLIVNFLYKIFGMHYYLGYIFNAALLAFVPVLIYLISFLITKDKRKSIISSIIYLILPANILYVIIFTPDHVALLLIILSVYLILHLINSSNIKKTNILIAILIGIVIGILEYFKSFGLVLVIATFIILVLKLLEKYERRKIVIYICYFLLITFSYWSSKNINHLIINSVVGTNTSKSMSGFALYIGIVGSGYYDVDLANDYFITFNENNKDVSKTNKIIGDKIKDYLAKNYSKLPKVIYNKTYRMYGSDVSNTSKLTWINYTIKQNNLYNYTSSKWFANIVQIIYIFVVIGTILISIQNIVNLKDANITFVILIVLGVACMFMLTEVQTRYRYAFEPLMCVLSGIGYMNMLDKRDKK